MFSMDELSTVLDEIGPNNATDPLDTAKMAGIIPVEWNMQEAVENGWFAELGYVMEANQMPSDNPALSGLLILGLAAGLILGRQEAAELLDSTDDLDVIEGLDWVPHND